jgi:chromosome segregation ATPase
MADSGALIQQYFALKGNIKKTKLLLALSEKGLASELESHPINLGEYNSLTGKLHRLNNLLATSGDEYQKFCNVSSNSDQAKAKREAHERMGKDWHALKKYADALLVFIEAHADRVNRYTTEQDELKTKLSALKSRRKEIMVEINAQLT